MKHQAVASTGPSPAADRGADTDGGRARSAHASDAARRLARTSLAALERVFVRGGTPDPGALVGWEFRGLNTPAWMAALGIRKFIKGFYLRNGEPFGYNTPVAQNGLDAAWIAKPSDDAPKRFGFYSVGPVDPTRRDNKYLHALLLDYGRGDNPRRDPSAGLRDYLVQVEPGNDDLLLGKAYYALGPLRVPTMSFFILERFRRGLADVTIR